MKRHTLQSAVLPILAMLSTFAIDAGARAQQEIEQIDPDAGAVAAINTLLQALALADEDARWKTLTGVLHPVLLIEGGTDVHPNYKFILGRQARALETYAQPAEIERVDRVRVVSGTPHRFGALEVDVVDRYYLKTTGDANFVVIVWTEAAVPKIVGFS
jgi:hypothetical protein